LTPPSSVTLDLLDPVPAAEDEERGIAGRDQDREFPDQAVVPTGCGPRGTID